MLAEDHRITDTEQICSPALYLNHIQEAMFGNERLLKRNLFALASGQFSRVLFALSVLSMTVAEKTKFKIHAQVL